MFIIYIFWVMTFFLGLFNAFGWVLLPWWLIVTPFFGSIAFVVGVILYANLWRGR